MMYDWDLGRMRVKPLVLRQLISYVLQTKPLSLSEDKQNTFEYLAMIPDLGELKIR